MADNHEENIINNLDSLRDDSDTGSVGPNQKDSDGASGGQLST